jgi:hypothetical protein
MKMSFMRVLIVCALGAIASTTQAGLIDVNDDTFDSLISQEFEVTRDSATNLDWLDVDAYTNVSWNDVNGLLGTVGHILEDWRHATQDEVFELFDSGRLSALPTGNWILPTTVNDATPGIHAQEHLGFSNEGDFNVTFRTQGYTSTPFSGPGNSNIAPYFEHLLTGGGWSTTASHDNYSRGGAYEWVGHWLVRTSPSEGVVPEPSTFSMLAFCGIAMAGYSRLRRRRK